LQSFSENVPFVILFALEKLSVPMQICVKMHQIKCPVFIGTPVKNFTGVINFTNVVNFTGVVNFIGVIKFHWCGKILPV
jgi:hypothetical protein